MQENPEQVPQESACVPVCEPDATGLSGEEKVLVTLQFGFSKQGLVECGLRIEEDGSVQSDQEGNGWQQVTDWFNTPQKGLRFRTTSDVLDCESIGSSARGEGDMPDASVNSVIRDHASVTSEQSAVSSQQCDSKKLGKTTATNTELLTCTVSQENEPLTAVSERPELPRHVENHSLKLLVPLTDQTSRSPKTECESPVITPRSSVISLGHQAPLLKPSCAPSKQEKSLSSVLSAKQESETKPVSLKCKCCNLEQACASRREEPTMLKPSAPLTRQGPIASISSRTDGWTEDSIPEHVLLEQRRSFVASSRKADMSADNVILPSKPQNSVACPCRIDQTKKTEPHTPFKGIPETNDSSRDTESSCVIVLEKVTKLPKSVAKTTKPDDMKRGRANPVSSAEQETPGVLQRTEKSVTASQKPVLQKQKMAKVPRQDVRSASQQRGKAEEDRLPGARKQVQPHKAVKAVRELSEQRETTTDASRNVAQSRKETQNGRSSSGFRAKRAPDMSRAWKPNLQSNRNTHDADSTSTRFCQSERKKQVGFGSSTPRFTVPKSKEKISDNKRIQQTRQGTFASSARMGRRQIVSNPKRMPASQTGRAPKVQDPDEGNMEELLWEAFFQKARSRLSPITSEELAVLHAMCAASYRHFADDLREKLQG